MAAPAQALIAAPFGSLLLEADGEFLLDIGLHTEAKQPIPPSTPLLREAARQFQAYFDDPRQTFCLPLKPAGTAYQRSVWQVLATIPPGAAQSYGQIARELRSSPRAVAGACRANPFPIAIPCHRVIASHGLGGYCGATDGALLELKRWLLRHEGYQTA